MENRITMDDFGVTHIFGNFHIFPLTFETQKAHDFHWFPHINITLLNCQKTSKGEDRWRMLEWLTMLRKAFWLYILKVAIEWETWWSTMEFWGALFYDVWGPVAATEAKPRGLADIQVAFVCLLHAFCFFLLPFSLQTFYRPLVACLLARFILLPVLLLACCGTHTQGPTQNNNTPLGPRHVRWRCRGGFSTAAANTCIPKTCCHWSADCTAPVDLSLLGDRQLPLHLCDAGWH